MVNVQLLFCNDNHIFQIIKFFYFFFLCYRVFKNDHINGKLYFHVKVKFRCQEIDYRQEELFLQ